MVGRQVQIVPEASSAALCIISMATKDCVSNVRPKKDLGIVVCCVRIGAFAQSHNPANDTEDRCSCFCQPKFDIHFKSRSLKG